MIRIIHWRILRLNTGKLPRSLRPSAVTSSLATTVPNPGHQFTGASLTYASRHLSSSWRRSLADIAFHSPVVAARLPVSNSAINSSMRRATLRSGSNHELKTCRKIHCVQR